MTTPLPAPRTRVSAKAKRQAAAAPLAVAVLRVSTQGQEDSGLGLAAQREAVEAFAAREGLTLVAVLEDTASGTVAPADRDGMSVALGMLAAGEAGTLVAAKVDRLSRKNSDFYALLDRGHREGWVIRTADGILDTGSGQGRLLAGVAALVAEIERDMIADRTRSALAAKRAAGARLGAPVTTPAGVRERIRTLALQGLTQAAIAAELNTQGLTTAQGREWTQPNVRRVLGTLRLDDEAAALSGAA